MTNNFFPYFLFLIIALVCAVSRSRSTFNPLSGHVYQDLLIYSKILPNCFTMTCQPILYMIKLFQWEAREYLLKAKILEYSCLLI